MTSTSRRRFVQAGSAASLAALAGVPSLVTAQTPIALRFSSSMTADENAAHFGTVMVIAMGLGLFAPPIGWACSPPARSPAPRSRTWPGRC